MLRLSGRGILLTAWVGVILCTAFVSAQEIVERHTLFSSGQDTPFELYPWSMVMEKGPGGLREHGICLWFNTDWQAKPWAGIRFDAEPPPTFTVTEEWVEKGFVRFLINQTVDRNGIINGRNGYQIKPLVDPPLGRYQIVGSQFIDRGRGVDEEATTWQEVLVPLKFFTQIKPGHRIGGFSFQTRGRIDLAFSLDDVEYVRFDKLPEWMVAQLNEDVKQAWVEWPAYDDLPDAVKADKHPLSVRNGAFVTPDGARAFLLNPYATEDSRLGYGNRNPEKLLPTWDLYDREKHGWIYDEVPTTEILCRLGFNSYSVTPAPQAWWDAAGYKMKNTTSSDSFLPVLAKRVTLPYFVDLVAWPWTMGKPGLKVEETALPPEAATIGRNHWTQYRIIGAGRKAWLDMWAVNARRYRDAGTNVAVLELMNEPGYMGESADHYAEFAQWLAQRYGSVEEVNRVWGAEFASLADAAVYRFSYENRPPAEQVLDYDEYLSDRFTEMIAAGVATVNGILPEALVGLQPMGGYLRTPHDAVWKHRIAKHETVVLAPTGGGRWTRGRGTTRPPGVSLMKHPIADAPIENDLLLAVADNKMIVDNETYLRGQTRQDTRNRLWEHVVCGLDGLTIFSWSKRGWVWWKSRANVQVDADKYPWSSLIPLARRTDALRGILDFSKEVQALAPKILPKPWGPEPKIGLLYSWANARRRVVEPERYDKTPVYYAALRYSHWNMCVLPSDEVIESGVPEGLDVVVAGGLTHVERDLPAALRQFVERGGILILGECDFTQDLHGQPLAASSQLVSSVRSGMDERPLTGLPTGGETETLFPGDVVAKRVEKLAVTPGTTTVLADAGKRPFVIRVPCGKGTVYYQGADLYGYSMAKVLHAILVHARPDAAGGSWLAARITEKEGRLAPNILVSRRSYGDRHAILLHNRDQYERTIQVALPGLTGNWEVTDALSDAPARTETGGGLGTTGITVQLAAAGPSVLLLERKPE